MDYITTLKQLIAALEALVALYSAQLAAQTPTIPATTTQPAATTTQYVINIPEVQESSPVLQAAPQPIGNILINQKGDCTTGTNTLIDAYYQINGAYQPNQDFQFTLTTDEPAWLAAPHNAGATYASSSIEGEFNPRNQCDNDGHACTEFFYRPATSGNHTLTVSGNGLSQDITLNCTD